MKFLGLAVLAFFLWRRCLLLPGPSMKPRVHWSDLRSGVAEDVLLVAACCLAIFLFVYE